MNIEEQNPHELDTTSTTPIVEETIVQEEISKEITSNDEDDDENDDIIDYSSLSKEELVSEVKKIRSSDAIKVSKKQLGEIKSAFDDLFHSERKEAHATFLSEGGEKDGFEYIDIDAKSFYDTLKEIHELKRKHKSQQEEQRVSNTRKKRILLDELRELVDGEETPNTFNQIKELQKTWRDTGHVAQADYQELNANYSALLDRYFSFRSIYFDLKNLDKDKNLELKTAIIGEVIALLEYENTLEAIKKLNELHAQYKSIGPVAEEFSDILWDNLKLVTDKVRDKRTAHIEAFKVKLDANLIEKKSLLPQLESFASIQAQSAKEWITLTEELTALQNRWKAIGMVPDEDKKSINDLFWAHSRAFYNNKNEFFNGLDNERKENHKKK